MKPGTVFYKMSGSGNDFLMVDGRYAHAEDFTAPAIMAACDRRRGVGADGVILLDPAAPRDAHFTFRFWNSDGSEGPMPAVDGALALHLTVNGYRLLEIRCDDEVYRSFLYAREVFRWIEETSKTVLGVEYGALLEPKQEALL